MTCYDTTALAGRFMHVLQNMAQFRSRPQISRDVLNIVSFLNCVKTTCYLLVYLESECSWSQFQILVGVLEKYLTRHLCPVLGSK
jgi:hypothetical protein